jgi:hypothetical protein
LRLQQPGEAGHAAAERGERGGGRAGRGVVGQTGSVQCSVHPSAAVHRITEHINKCVLDNGLRSHDRFRVPLKWWGQLLRILQVAGDIGLLFRPS